MRIEEGKENQKAVVTIILQTLSFRKRAKLLGVTDQMLKDMMLEAATDTYINSIRMEITPETKSSRRKLKVDIEKC